MLLAGDCVGVRPALVAAAQRAALFVDDQLATAALETYVAGSDPARSWSGACATGSATGSSRSSAARHLTSQLTELGWQAANTRSGADAGDELVTA